MESNNKQSNQTQNSDDQQLTSQNKKKYYNQFTFLEKQSYYDKSNPFYAPPPDYLTLQILKQCPLLMNSKERWQGLEIKKDGEIFEGIITDLLKNVAESIAQGRGMVGVSMPIRIFEPRSMNERMIDQFAYIPKYLNSLQSNDPILRIKAVASAIFAGLTISISQLKPFTPLLGETYEGEFEDGTKIFCEHIIHHPPIVSFYLTGKNFRYYGHYEFQAKPNFNYNIIRMIQEGPNNLEFDDGQKITWTMPCVKIQGLMMGDRQVARTGNIVIENKNKQLKCVIQLGKKGKGIFSYNQVDQCLGKIYYYDNQIQELDQKKINEMELEKICEYDFLSQIDDIEGCYNKYLKIGKLYQLLGQTEVWNIDQHLPTKFCSVDKPLPSDSRYREDLIWLKYGNQDFAQKWKIRVEAQQKIDRELRKTQKQK